MRDQHNGSPARLQSPDRLVNASSPAKSRLELGSSNTTSLDRHRARGPVPRAAAVRLITPGRRPRSACCSHPSCAGSSRGNRPAGGRNDFLGIGVVLEPADILRHRAGKQLHILRQVADILAELLRIPLR